MPPANSAFPHLRRTQGGGSKRSEDTGVAALPPLRLPHPPRLENDLLTLAEKPRAKEVTMNPKHNEVRCKTCHTLLAKVDKTGLTILRGGLQATIDGTFRATLVCYIPRCRSLNILNLSTEQRRAEVRAAE